MKAIYCSVALLLLSRVALAADAVDAGATTATATCTELIPTGAVRPLVRESVSTIALAGYEVRLTVEVTHGSGETVMPDGFRLQEDAALVKALKAEGLAFSSRDGLLSSQAMAPVAAGEKRLTRVEFVLVPLPDKSGRQNVTLPSLPIAIGRASGAQMIVCTSPHATTIEDPTSNLTEALPRPNPPPRQQIEPWLLPKIILWGLAIALGSFAAGMLARAWWRKRPKPAPPPPPPRPPWEIALEKLRIIEAEGLLKDGKYVAHHDRVTDVVREFMGNRFGFDGLECTSAEMVSRLKRRVEAVPHLPAMKTFFDDADLIKFAKMTPTQEVCERVLGDAYRFVRALSPQPEPRSTVTA